MGSGITKENKIKTKYYEIRNLRIGQVIGKGGFAIVYQAYHNKEKKVVAVKETNFSRSDSHKNELNMTLSELEALKHAGNHPFLVKLHCAFREGCCCYLVMDPLLGGDLRYHLRNFQLFREHHVAYFVACIGSALHHLHVRGILHRDVKPENVILGGTGIPYLTDFGTAFIELEKRVPLCNLSSGTLPYLSPESLTESRRHSYQSDYWSLGVLAFELLFNSRPFDKHCPKSFIYFVDNQYKLMWTFIENNNNNNNNNYNNFNINNTNTNTNNNNTNNNNTQIDQLHPTILSSSLSTSLLSPPPSSSQQQQSSSKLPPFDFEQVCNSIDEETRLNSLPYPQHHIPLLKNGNLPLELMVMIPMYSCCGEPVSSECRAMLSGLLDVRIPYRLGNILHYSDFSNHPWFQKFLYQFIDQNLHIQSPLKPDLGELQHFYSSKLSHLPLPIPETVELSPELEAKLSKYSYKPPPSYRLTIFPSTSTEHKFEPTRSINSESVSAPFKFSNHR